MAKCWEVYATLRFDGEINSLEADEIRKELLGHPWVVSDAIALQRESRYLAAATFEVEATNEDDAVDQANNALERLRRKTGVARAALHVELAASVG